MLRAASETQPPATLEQAFPTMPRRIVPDRTACASPSARCARRRDPGQSGVSGSTNKPPQRTRSTATLPRHGALAPLTLYTTCRHLRSPPKRRSANSALSPISPRSPSAARPRVGPALGRLSRHWAQHPHATPEQTRVAVKADGNAERQLARRSRGDSSTRSPCR